MAFIRMVSRVHNLLFKWQSYTNLNDKINRAIFLHPKSYFSTHFVSSMPDFYQILGVPSDATQTEIKQAFYNLSKKHHPDVSDDKEESKLKFIEISAAYEILGNAYLRNRYDKGSLQATDNMNAPPIRPDLYKRRSRYRSRFTPPSGRTQYYDYDAWYQHHYQESLQAILLREHLERMNVENSTKNISNNSNGNQRQYRDEAWRRMEAETEKEMAFLRRTAPLFILVGFGMLGWIPILDYFDKDTFWTDAVPPDKSDS